MNLALLAIFWRAGLSLLQFSWAFAGSSIAANLLFQAVVEIHIWRRGLLRGHGRDRPCGGRSSGVGMNLGIVTISLNQAKYLPEAIQSVRLASPARLRYVIVDPGSMDGSREIIERHRSRFSQVILEPDRGPADGLNNGFAAFADDDILGYLNSDDRFTPGALDSVLGYFECHPEMDVLCGAIRIIDRRGRPSSRWRTPDRIDLRRYAYEACYFWQQATFFRCRAFQKAGGFNVNNRTAWDGELVVDMALAGCRFGYLNQCLGDFRVYDAMTLGSGRLPRERIEDRRHMREKILHAGIRPASRLEAGAMKLLYKCNLSRHLSYLAGGRDAGCAGRGPAMNTVGEKSSAPMGAASWTALAVGIASPVAIQLVGVVYLAEILLAGIGLWALLASLSLKKFWQPPFSTLCLLLALSLAGYIAADLVWQTDSGRWLRGWARIAFLASNFIGLYFLCWKRPGNFLLYCAGSAAASLIALALEGRLFTDWKFGASVPVTLLIACLVSIAPAHRWLAPAAGLGAIGVLHILLDSRSLGGCCVAACLVLLARQFTQCKPQPSRSIALWAAALAGIGMGVYAYIWSDQSYGQRRLQSMAWRAASLATAWSGVADSPWIGNGSQANDFRFQSEYDGRYAASSGERYGGLATDTSTFTPHSHILQAWFEAGIAGAAFFVFVAWRLAGALRSCVLSRAAGALSALFIVCLLRSGWHLLFSPFAGPARLEVAAAAVVICLVHWQSRAPSHRTATLRRMPSQRWLVKNA